MTRSASLALSVLLLALPASAAEVPRGVPLDPDDRAAWIMEVQPGGPFAAIASTVGTRLFIGRRGYLSVGQMLPGRDVPRPWADLGGAELLAPWWGPPNACVVGAGERAPQDRVEVGRDEATGVVTVTWIELPVDGCATATFAVKLAPRAGGEGVRVEFIYEALPRVYDLAEQPRAGIIVGEVAVELFPDEVPMYERGKLLIDRGSDRDAGRWVFELGGDGALVGDRDGDGIRDGEDVDGDGVPDGDNCLDHPNPRQRNLDREILGPDGDGIGDACDDDLDNDGVFDGLDNCPLRRNRDQRDADRDGVGDVCEDADTDGVPDDQDLCPHDVDSAQLDLDEDGVGDACDTDIDGDGRRLDAHGRSRRDPCPYLAEGAWLDRDHDGLGDGCDLAPASACKGFTCLLQLDSDGDGHRDISDTCPTVADDQRDVDGDRIGDVCDPDDDDDGVFDRDEYQEQRPLMEPGIDLRPLPGAGW